MYMNDNCTEQTNSQILLSSLELTVSLIQLKCNAYDMIHSDGYDSVGEQLVKEVKIVADAISSLSDGDQEIIQKIVYRINKLQVKSDFKKEAKDILLSLS